MSSSASAFAAFRSGSSLARIAYGALVQAAEDLAGLRVTARNLAVSGSWPRQSGVHLAEALNGPSADSRRTQVVGNGCQGRTLTQHVAGGGLPGVVLHSADGGLLMRSFTT